MPEKAYVKGVHKLAEIREKPHAQVSLGRQTGVPI